MMQQSSTPQGTAPYTGICCPHLHHLDHRVQREYQHPSLGIHTAQLVSSPGGRTVAHIRRIWASPGIPPKDLLGTGKKDNRRQGGASLNEFGTDVVSCFTLDCAKWPPTHACLSHLWGRVQPASPPGSCNRHSCPARPPGRLNHHRAKSEAAAVGRLRALCKSEGESRDQWPAGRKSCARQAKGELGSQGG